MRFRSSFRRSRAIVAIDITSLVDVVFLLIIFLLVSTTFKREEHAFPIDLPTAGTDQVTVTTDKTTIFVTKAGDLHVLVVPGDLPEGATADDAKAEKVSREDLRAKLAELKRRHPDAPIAIRAEKDTSYQKMIDVVALIEEAGFTSLWFPYERTESPGGPQAPPGSGPP
jgi:biopolymer transport protein ExbD